MNSYGNVVDVRFTFYLILIFMLVGSPNGKTQPVATRVELVSLQYELTSGEDCDCDGYRCLGGDDDPTIEVVVVSSFSNGDNMLTHKSLNNWQSYDCDLGARNPKDPLFVYRKFDNPSDFKFKLMIEQGFERDVGTNDHVCLGGGEGTAELVHANDYSICDQHIITVERICSGAKYTATFEFSYHYVDLIDPGQVAVPHKYFSNRQELLLRSLDTTSNLQQPTGTATFSWQYLKDNTWVNTGITTKNAPVYDYILQETSGIGSFTFRRLSTGLSSACNGVMEHLPTNFVQIRISDTCYLTEFVELFDDNSINGMSQSSTLDPFVPWIIKNDTFGGNNKYIEIGYEPEPSNPVVSYLETYVSIPDTFYFLDYHLQFDLGELRIAPPAVPSNVRLYIDDEVVRTYPNPLVLYRSGLENEVWNATSIPLPIGDYYIRWEYTKGTSYTAHSPDYFRMDDIIIRKKHPDFEALVDLFYSTNGPIDWIESDGWRDRHLNLDCDVCSWYGVTCDSISNRVTKIELKNNGLNGKLSATIDQLAYLQELNLSSNPDLLIDFSDGLFNLDRVKRIELSGCQADSELEADVQNLDSLKYLNLSNIGLSGRLLPEIGYLSHCDTLDLSFNLLEGEVPANLVSMTGLKVLRLNDNLLSGELPDTLFSMNWLRELRIDSNMLTGRLKPHYSGWYNMDLEILDLSNNMFEGCIPPSFQSYCEIPVFKMSNNPRLPYQGQADSICLNPDSLCCELNIHMEELYIGSGVYKAVDTISLAGGVAVGADVIFSAGQSVTLLDTFLISESSDVLLEIEGCDSHWPYEDCRIYQPGGSNNQAFGFALDMSASNLAVGMPYSSVGQVLIYTLVNDKWLFDKQISPYGLIFSSEFGSEIVLDSTSLIVSAPHYEKLVFGPDEQGAVYIYSKSGNLWNETQIIEAPTPSAYAHFGRSISRRGDTLVVADDLNNVFVYTHDGNDWNYKESIPGPSSFGADVVLTESGLYIGAPEEVVSGMPQCGLVYFYDRLGNMDTIAPVVTDSFLRFGENLSSEGDRLLVGVKSFDHPSAENNGIVYEYSGTSHSRTFYPVNTSFPNLNFGRHVEPFGIESAFVGSANLTRNFENSTETDFHYPENGVIASFGEWVAISQLNSSTNNAVVLYRLVDH